MEATLQRVILDVCTPAIMRYREAEIKAAELPVYAALVMATRDERLSEHRMLLSYFDRNNIKYQHVPLKTLACISQRLGHRELIEDFARQWREYGIFVYGRNFARIEATASRGSRERYEVVMGSITFDDVFSHEFWPRGVMDQQNRLMFPLLAPDGTLPTVGVYTPPDGSTPVSRKRRYQAADSVVLVPPPRPVVSLLRGISSTGALSTDIGTLRSDLDLSIRLGASRGRAQLSAMLYTLHGRHLLSSTMREAVGVLRAETTRKLGALDELYRGEILMTYQRQHQKDGRTIADGARVICATMMLQEFRKLDATLETGTVSVFQRNLAELEERVKLETTEARFFAPPDLYDKLAAACVNEARVLAMQGFARSLENLNGLLELPRDSLRGHPSAAHMILEPMRKISDQVSLDLRRVRRSIDKMQKSQRDHKEAEKSRDILDRLTRLAAAQDATDVTGMIAAELAAIVLSDRYNSSSGAGSSTWLSMIREIRVCLQPLLQEQARLSDKHAREATAMFASRFEVKRNHNNTAASVEWFHRTARETAERVANCHTEIENALAVQVRYADSIERQFNETVGVPRWANWVVPDSAVEAVLALRAPAYTRCVEAISMPAMRPGEARIAELAISARLRRQEARMYERRAAAVAIVSRQHLRDRMHQQLGARSDTVRVLERESDADSHAFTRLLEQQSHDERRADGDDGKEAETKEEKKRGTGGGGERKTPVVVAAADDEEEEKKRDDLAIQQIERDIANDVDGEAGKTLRLLSGVDSFTGVRGLARGPERQVRCDTFTTALREFARVCSILDALAST